MLTKNINNFFQNNFCFVFKATTTATSASISTLTSELTSTVKGKYIWHNLIGLSIKNFKIRIVFIESGYGLVVRAEVSNPIGCGFESQCIRGGCNQSYFFEKKTTIGSQLGYTKNKVNFFLQQKNK